MIKYDNCKDCKSLCEHAGKDREFVCPGGKSCKVTNTEVLDNHWINLYSKASTETREKSKLHWIKVFAESSMSGNEHLRHIAEHKLTLATIIDCGMEV